MARDKSDRDMRIAMSPQQIAGVRAAWGRADIDPTDPASRRPFHASGAAAVARAQAIAELNRDDMPDSFQLAPASGLFGLATNAGDAAKRRLREAMIEAVFESIQRRNSADRAGPPTRPSSPPPVEPETPGVPAPPRRRNIMLRKEGS